MSFGCGEKTVVGQSSTKSEQSQACFDCHQSGVDTVTGKLIVDEWNLSHHNTSNAASCSDCHEPEQGHPSGCNLCHGGTPVGSSNHVSKNPDQDGKCSKCHNSVNGLFPRGSRRDHFNPNVSSTFRSYTASYVSTNYIGNCRKCHNPHDPTSNIEYNRTWAQTGHGRTTDAARVSSNFKLSGITVPADLAVSGSFCVRCHTTTGFVNFVESTNFGKKFTDERPFGAASDNTREVTACDACHVDYSFKLRAVPRVTIYYNFSSATQASAGNPGGHAKISNNGVTYPDLGSSNVCVPCHSNRGGVGSLIKLLSNMGVDFAKIGRPGTHWLGGAGLLTSKIGYEFTGKEYVTGIGADTGHNTVGLNNGKGPCLTCHMNKTINSDSHTFKPVIHDTAQFDLYTTNRTWSQVYSMATTYLPATQKISSITSLTCNTSNCHAVALTAADLNRDKEGYLSALAVLNKWVRLVVNVPVKPQLPFNATTNKARTTTQWDYLGTGTGPDLMGAAFNLSALNNDPGGYTHNPLYVKRLIYDSIYFLSTKATDPVLGINQYPTVQQFNVADAINYLTTTTATTLETVNGVANTQARALITTHQADAAIQWLYGKPRISLTPADKLKRPGDN